MFPKATDDPMVVFSTWLAEATAHSDIAEPTAMCLATASAAGIPSARMVLLKGQDARGFVFYTNHESHKGRELLENPHASLCFHWQPLGKQVRIEGAVEQVSAEESDAYFNSRPRDSRIGAWASQQSRELPGGTTQLMAEAAKVGLQYGMREIPRPPHWGGFRVVPRLIEFWQDGKFRLHQRLEFTHEGESWSSRRLYP